MRQKKLVYYGKNKPDIPDLSIYIVCSCILL